VAGCAKFEVIFFFFYFDWLDSLARFHSEIIMKLWLF
jgi:hypothetical protein